MLTFKQIEEILYPDMDEDATYAKFEDSFWEHMMENGKGEEAILKAIDNGEFWDWLDQYVGEDEWVYK